MLVVGFVAAVLAAVTLSVGAMLESAGARRAGPDGRAILQPLFLVGVVVDLVGWALSVVALRYLPVFAVQSILAGSIVITVVASHPVFGAPLRRVDLIAAGSGLAGLAMIAASAGDAPAGKLPPAGTPILVLVFITLITVGFIAARGENAVLQALLGGLSFSGVPLCVRAVRITPDVAGDVTLVLRQPLVYLVVGFALTGVTLFSVALQRGAVGLITATNSVTQVVVPGVVGILVLGDEVRPGWIPVLIVGAAVSLGSVVALARSPAQRFVAG